MPASPSARLRRHAVALATCLSLAASACAPVWSRPRVALDVIDRDDGQWLAPVAHRGERWIAGVPGHRYAVRLTNTSDRRVLVVLSIDGVNAVTGQTASPSQAGYVLDPWQSTEVAGWRKSMDDVAQFVFTDLPDSYAARTGRPLDVGVIGIAVFDERTYAPPSPPPPVAMAGAARRAGGMAREQSAAAPASAARGAAMPHTEQRMGTGHGQREWAPTMRTTFERASTRPAQVSQLRYDDTDTLVARGVLPRWEQPWRGERTPRAFPNGFVADPPGG